MWVISFALQLNFRIFLFVSFCFVRSLGGAAENVVPVEEVLLVFSVVNLKEKDNFSLLNIFPSDSLL